MHADVPVLSKLEFKYTFGSNLTVLTETSSFYLRIYGKQSTVERVGFKSSETGQYYTTTQHK